MMQEHLREKTFGQSQNEIKSITPNFHAIFMQLSITPPWQDLKRDSKQTESPSLASSCCFQSYEFSTVSHISCRFQHFSASRKMWGGGGDLRGPI